MKAAGYLSEISQTNKEIIEARKNLYAAKIDEVSVLLKSFRLISGSKKEDDLATAISNLQDKTDAKLNEILDLGKEADQKNFSQEIRFKLYEAEEKYAINKEKLSKLKMDVDFVDDLQKSFDNRVAQLDKGIEQAGNILNQAEEIVDQISRMADHKMAEEKCFVTENLLKNIRIIKNFVKVEAIKQFDSEQNALSKEVSRLKSEMSAISTEIEKLDKEMLDVQKNISSLPPKNDAEPKKENKVAISEAANEVSKSTEQTSKINLPKKEPLKKGFFGEFIEWFKDFWLFLKSLIGV